MDPSVMSIGLVIFGALFSGGFLLMAISDHRHAQIEARLQELPNTPLKSLNDPPGATTPGGAGRRPARLSGNEGSPFTNETSGNQRSTASRDRSRPPGSVWTAFKLAGLIMPVLAGAILAHLEIVDRKIGLMFGSLVGLACVGLPTAWVHHKIAVHHSALRRALPDFLDLMIVCLESGLSVQGTIARVGDEISIAHPRLGSELRFVQRDIELGSTVDTAFRNFANRSGLDAVRTLSSFIREAQRFGSQLGDALRSHAEMLRYQREQAAEEKAQKAAIKMLFPTLLLILPAVFVVLVGRQPSRFKRLSPNDQDAR